MARGGGGGGCCPPMDLMRSEAMQLVQVIIPTESAHLAVSYLGDLGLLQFKDLNADKSPFQRTYAAQACSIQLSEMPDLYQLYSDEGEVLSWGHGGHGQLGHPSLQNRRVPLAIKALCEERIVYIACGGSTSAAISEKGDLYLWRNARDCQLGVPGLLEVQPLPVKVNFLTEQR